MDENIQDQAALTEANAIVNDKNHPKHEAFWKGDKVTNDDVQQLYAKAVRATYGDSGDEVIARNAAEHGHQPPRGNASADTATEAGEESPVVVATRAQLEWEWGRDIDANMSQLTDAVVERLGSVQALDEIAEKLGIFDNPEARAEGLKYLYKHVLKRR